MNLFRRTIRLLWLVVGIIAGVVVALATIFVRLMVQPVRQRLGATPADRGLAYEEITFPAYDGVRLAGWFVPAPDAAAGPKPTILFVHSWLGNRLGDSGEGLLARLSNAQAIELLRPTQALHAAGYNVCLFDLRNHGVSAAGGPVSFGIHEANDVLGAVEYLQQRPDVDPQRVGVVGLATGANAALYALARGAAIKSLIAVQPTTAAIYSAGFARSLLGPLGQPVLALASLMYERQGGVPLTAVEPRWAALRAGDCPILFVQGVGDRWGRLDDVAEMVAATPAAVTPLYPLTTGRYGGYVHLIDNPQQLLAHFKLTL